MDARIFADAVAAAGLAGAVGLIGGRDGTRFSTATGASNTATGEAMREDHLFQIASMTKAIASVAAMQLVEQGRLSLDGPIGDVLPDLADPQVIAGFDEAGVPHLRPAARPVTLRHLLTHTSGLGYDFISMDQLRARQGVMPAPGSKAAITTPLIFDPGERWEYGVNTDWVGLAVEAVSGMTLGDYLEAHVTGPLGMTDTAFRAVAGAEPRMAAIHARAPDGSLIQVPMSLGGGEFNSGGGGLSSTGADYMRFLRMVANAGTLDGVTIIKPDTVAELCRNQISGFPAGRMGSTMPELAPPYDPFPGMECGWSLAFLINPEPGPNGRSAGSLAWAGIFNSYYWIDPVQDVIGVFLSQHMPFGDAGALAAAGTLERMAYGLA
ncbi:beta-lactamase family protein [Sphingomonas lacunae]|uniref:Beta-lactamase family protein n=1 Tax=Sphingomonas lacunae TaxID=2698828 RepID=A0A6M4ARS5_9SPHN|nr:serine hydrolase domain-containing protein [Sphingomonas lacunae]QJQ31733.1 beta-lactamase family protein [Sphingomonas lacunae]